MSEKIALGQINRVGFTGTQNGMTKLQLMSCTAALTALHGMKANIFEHGDCIGADAQAHAIAVHLCFDIIIHPSYYKNKRAFCTGAKLVMDPKPYLLRNRNIVRDVDILVAAPSGPETLRSGTWSTVRYAMKIGKTVTIVWPDGRLEGLANVAGGPALFFRGG